MRTKNKARLAFELLEKEMEVIRLDEMRQILGGTGEGGQAITGNPSDGWVTKALSDFFGREVKSGTDDAGNWIIQIGSGAPIPLTFTLNEMVVTPNGNYLLKDGQQLNNWADIEETHPPDNGYTGCGTGSTGDVEPIVPGGGGTLSSYAGGRSVGDLVDVLANAFRSNFDFYNSDGIPSEPGIWPVGHPYAGPYDADGYNSNGYTVDGYDRTGYNSMGVNINGTTNQMVLWLDQLVDFTITQTYQELFNNPNVGQVGVSHSVGTITGTQGALINVNTTYTNGELSGYDMNLAGGAQTVSFSLDGGFSIGSANASGISTSVGLSVERGITIGASLSSGVSTTGQEYNYSSGGAVAAGLVIIGAYVTGGASVALEAVGAELISIMAR